MDSATNSASILNQQNDQLKNDSDDLTSSFDLESLDPEQRQKIEEELKVELAKVRQNPKYICLIDDKSDFKLTIYKFKKPSVRLKRKSRHYVRC